MGLPGALAMSKISFCVSYSTLSCPVSARGPGVSGQGGLGLGLQLSPEHPATAHPGLPGARGPQLLQRSQESHSVSDKMPRLLLINFSILEIHRE